MSDKVEIEKLDYLINEVTRFLIYCVAITDNEEEQSVMNPVVLIEKLTEFHDKYGNRYNNNQLVNQFIKQNLGGLDMVKEYSKVKDRLDEII